MKNSTNPVCLPFMVHQGDAIERPDGELCKVTVGVAQRFLQGHGHILIV